MKYTRLALALTGALLLATVAPSTAEEKKGTNQSAPDAVAKAKSSPEATAVQQLRLAYSLIEYGRKNDAPEALITAARIIAANGTVESKEKPTREKSSDAPKDKKEAKPAPDNSARALLAEAKKLSKNDPAVVALANSIELPRGAVGGPKRTVEVVEALSTDNFKIRFREDEVARVLISGDGDTRLDLYIYDEGGNLITSRVGPGDDALASWVPKWTGVFVIKVVNRGRVSNRYTILTN